MPSSIQQGGATTIMRLQLRTLCGALRRPSERAARANTAFDEDTRLTLFVNCPNSSCHSTPLTPGLTEACTRLLLRRRDGCAFRCAPRAWMTPSHLRAGKAARTPAARQKELQDAIEKLTFLVSPHIESFDYWVDEGLQRSVEDMDPVEVASPDGRSITCAPLSSCCCATPAHLARRLGHRHQARHAIAGQRSQGSH